MKLAELEGHLRRYGCVFEREGGAHSIWLDPSSGKLSGVPRRREIKEGTARALCKQLEIPQP